jgi:molybdenum cofactor synthesis domain-containing protein
MVFCLFSLFPVSCSMLAARSFMPPGATALAVAQRQGDGPNTTTTPLDMLRNTLRAKMTSKLRAAIIVVSETASKDASTDKCIPALQEVFQQDGGDRWELAETKIVSDDVSAIRSAIKSYTDGADNANLVVTSGGTGFAQKDVTPEASLQSILITRIAYLDMALKVES